MEQIRRAYRDASSMKQESRGFSYERFKRKLVILIYTHSHDILNKISFLEGKNMTPSPYTPGAGFMPNYLAGREKNIADAEKYMNALILKYPQQSVVYYGLRGVGKTVLINAIESSASNLNILYQHFEVKEKGNFIADLIAVSNSFINQMSIKENVTALIKKATGIIKALAITYDSKNETFSTGFNGNYDPYVASGNLSIDLTELFVLMGTIAADSSNTICYFIDEIQYAKQKDLEAVITAIHRVNQLRLPIMIFSAGLPKILKTLGEAKSYSERLFKFEEIDSLKYDDAASAILEPANDFDVIYEPSAVNEIINITDGYPYFIQQICSTIWDELDCNTITLDLVKKSIPIAFDILDKSFFKVRYDRCTKLEKSFIMAMVKCGNLPCTIANVAKVMGREVQSISPTRGSLIGKGVVYSTQHGEIDFTVPQFDSYLKRISPTLE